MLLYHGFPRGAITQLGRQGANRLGVAQLRTLVETGLLLTPEWFRIPEDPLAAKREGESPKSRFLQVRACFTLADRLALWEPRGVGVQSHVTLFGDFAIGIEPSNARQMGAVPVLYMYDAFEGMTPSPDAVNMTLEVLFNLRQLRSLAIAVARLEARAANPRRSALDDRMLDKLGYHLVGDPKIRRKIEQLDQERAHQVIGFLDTDRDAAWNLVDKIDIMLNMFQTADFRKSDLSGLQQPHAYYEQREWRIVRLFNPLVRCQALGPDYELDASVGIPEEEREHLRNRLRAANPGFFDDWHLDNSAILRGTAGPAGDRAFFEFVDEVICPSTVAPEVSDLIGGVDFQQVPVPLPASHKRDSSEFGEESDARSVAFVRSTRR